MKHFLRTHFDSLGSGARSLPMEGVRGFAALLVFFVHFNSLFRPYFPEGFASDLFTFTGGIGHTGVDIFFVLSGFLIYGIVFDSRVTYAQFLLRRGRRLYPVFLFVVLLYVVLSLIFPEVSRLPKSVPRAVLYVAANAVFLPGMTSITPMITVAWSLSYEWAFYVSIPILIIGLRMKSWKPWHRIVFFLTLACIQYGYGVAGRSSHVRLALFASGIALWEITRHWRPTFRNGLWGEAAVVLAFLLNLAGIGWVAVQNGDSGVVLSRVNPIYVPSLFVTIFFLVLYGLFYGGLLQAIFSWDYLRWIGNMSYSFYLIHGLTLHGLRYATETVIPASPQTAYLSFLLLLAGLAATLIVAAALFLLVEKPLSFRATRTASLSEVAPTLPEVPVS